MIIHNGKIVNDGLVFEGFIEVEGETITNVSEGSPTNEILAHHTELIDAMGAYIMPGVIDTHVHFREPGLTHKADIASESRAALAGGVTTFFDMPNTKPVTDSIERVQDKERIAAEVSPIEGRFFIAATNDNIDYLEQTDLSQAPGIKLFMGTSTGNMAVGSDELLNRVFALDKIIVIHAEDDAIISQNAQRIAAEYPEGKIPISRHPDIRSREACISATRKAIELARKHNTCLHIAHISTLDELQMIAQAKAEGLKVTAEACVLHLLFERSDYERLGTAIKCNPAVKDSTDRDVLIEQCRAGGIIDTIATDHAPHLWGEKQGDALHAASGAPSIQFSLIAMLDMAQQNNIPIYQIARLMSHNPATIFGLNDRGYLRPGHRADIVIVKPNCAHTVMPTDILSKCGWSPFLGHTFHHQVSHVISGGKICL